VLEWKVASRLHFPVVTPLASDCIVVVRDAPCDGVMRLFRSVLFDVLLKCLYRPALI
jgi:hypothetical protein